MTPGRATFRVDASLQIGSGHVMRCLTLAESLRTQGTESEFICREHPGNLIDLIRRRGFSVETLPPGQGAFKAVPANGGGLPAHAEWLGVDWFDDATATAALVATSQPDWLVVDHYALDRRWEQAMRPHCGRLMVIDDLADRPHDCDLLLDQNLGRAVGDYAGLVPDACRVLAGTRYALLRPEFAELREYSLQRRRTTRLRRLLIFMGGMDQANITAQVLEALAECPLPERCTITVVMGSQAPGLTQVRTQATSLPVQCNVLVDVTDMARLMAESDLAIGAAGTTSWERCALGLPSIVAILAENQWPIARALADAGAARVIETGSIQSALAQTFLSLSDADLVELSQAASSACDGRGATRVTSCMVSTHCLVRPMTRADLDAVLRWRNDESIRRFMYTRDEISPAEHAAWFDRVGTDSHRHLLIVEKAGSPFGFVQFSESGGGVAEWGFYVAPEAAKGAGTTLAHLALSHAFDELGFRKVCGEALAFNDRSRAFHQKMGFVEEGVLRDHYFDGSCYHNVHRFGLLASQWRAQQQY